MRELQGYLEIVEEDGAHIVAKLTPEGRALLDRQKTDFRQSEEDLISQSQHFWNNESHPRLKSEAHWRNEGVFSDEGRWTALGREHLRIYQEFAQALAIDCRRKRIVEWGCGGGANAVQFGPLTDEFIGVDISARTLAECDRQMKLAGLNNFRPILVGANNPEVALAKMPGPCDLLLSTYVFECLPSPEYGVRLLKIARNMLAPAGLAVIQIKYSEADWKTRPRRWNYARNLAWNATYRLEEFWTIAQQCGLTPRLMTLVPYEKLVNDSNYAFFLLVRA